MTEKLMQQLKQIETTQDANAATPIQVKILDARIGNEFPLPRYETAYEYAKADIANVIEKILMIKQFHLHDPEIIWRCLQEYKENAADFADHFIANMNSKHECEFTITFDKKASRLTHMKLLP